MNSQQYLIFDNQFHLKSSVESAICNTFDRDGTQHSNVILHTKNGRTYIVFEGARAECESVLSDIKQQLFGEQPKPPHISDDTQVLIRYLTRTNSALKLFKPEVLERARREIVELAKA